MNRNQKIDQKALEIQGMLDKWAKKEHILKSDERLIFTLGIRQLLVVREPIDDFLNMTFEDFFTRKRIEEAGFSAKLLYTRIRNSLANIQGSTRNRPYWLSATAKFETVGDLVALDDISKLLRVYNFGKKSLEIIKGVLSYNGIEFNCN